MKTNLLELIKLFPELPADYAKKLVQKALEVKEGNLINLANFIGSVDTPLPLYEIITGSKSKEKADYVWRIIYDLKNKKTNTETQKLSRQGLKEIHSVACTRWKEALEHYGTRNPLEDYVELSKQEVQTMFNECTEEQLPIVSKYLKEDDLSVYFGDKAKKGEHNYKKWVAVVDFVGVVDQEKRDWLINYFQQLEDNGNMQIPTNINGIIDTE
jgi:excinuclease UvrABC ATPase subunit